MSDETNEEKNDDSENSIGLTDSQAAETPNEADATTEGEFNPADWEAQYGLEEGALRDCKSVEEVFAAVAEMADKTILAGLTAPTAEANPSDFPKVEPEKPAPTTTTQTQASGATGNAELDAIKQELGLLRSELVKTREAAMHAEVVEGRRRLDKEIDSWASPKYGVGKNRNSKQFREYKALLEEMKTYIAGKAALGQPIPDVEAAARQVRAFHDDTFKPTALKLNKQTPLGTPGTSREHKGDKGPKNIYEVIRQL